MKEKCLIYLFAICFSLLCFVSLFQEYEIWTLNKQYEQAMEKLEKTEKELNAKVEENTIFVDNIVYNLLYKKW